jgi:hypothetical protein
VALCTAGPTPHIAEFRRNSGNRGSHSREATASPHRTVADITVDRTGLQPRPPHPGQNGGFPPPRFRAEPVPSAVPCGAEGGRTLRPGIEIGEVPWGRVARADGRRRAACRSPAPRNPPASPERGPSRRIGPRRTPTPTSPANVRRTKSRLQRGSRQSISSPGGAEEIPSAASNTSGPAPAASHASRNRPVPNAPPGSTWRPRRRTTFPRRPRPRRGARRPPAWRGSHGRSRPPPRDARRRRIVVDPARPVRIAGGPNPMREDDDAAGSKYAVAKTGVPTGSLQRHIIRRGPDHIGSSKACIGLVGRTWPDRIVRRARKSPSIRTSSVRPSRRNSTVGPEAVSIRRRPSRATTRRGVASNPSASISHPPHRPQGRSVPRHLAPACPIGASTR